ncbi:cobaltochelatase subunit CobN [Methanolobus vulcani]|uniref:Cobaltochelatase subunit CobN n=2 Tax=Methanolobus vulcani TaxID=38026 RepID=A0A7Z8KRQ5_9EURY|nr:cobaltochelatase subunit CobN [Methanolobus vulcani]
MSALENAHDNGAILYRINPGIPESCSSTQVSSLSKLLSWLMELLHMEPTESESESESCSSCHINGDTTTLYGIESMGTTALDYFDYISDGTNTDPITALYNNMSTEEDGLENAEELLVSQTIGSKITYIAYSESEALQLASETNSLSDLIEYNCIGYYNVTSKTLSEEIIDAAETGYLSTQDVIFIGSGILNNETVMNALEIAHDNGAKLYRIDPATHPTSTESCSSCHIDGDTTTFYGMEPMETTAPDYFDYISDGTNTDPITTLYNSMSTEGEGLENAEELLVYLASDSSEFVKSSSYNGVVHVSSNKFLFVLGTDYNQDALKNAAQDTDISDNLDITIVSTEDMGSNEFDFSGYGLIFIESQDESTVDGWTSEIKSAKEGGANVIGYNISSNITLPNIDLSDAEYTDIERYWIQGGETNMRSMLTLMGQNFSGLWKEDEIPEPVIMNEKLDITLIFGSECNVYYVDKILEETNVITDRYNIQVMDGSEAIANLTDATDQDIILLDMIGAAEIAKLVPVLSIAKANGAEIGFSTPDPNGLDTINMIDPPHSVLKEYMDNGGMKNIENMIRYAGAEIGGIYIEYDPVGEPTIPDDGIYHPDAFPMVFGDSTEYLAWYADHGYNESAPTIGIINYEIQKEPLYLTTDDAIIRYLESKGCNVIYSTSKVCEDDVDYFTKDGEVLVDAIISLQCFYINYEDQEEGVEYLQKYNVPVLKAVQDAFTSPEDYYNSTFGTSVLMRASSVTQPEIDGCLDFIWVSGYVTEYVDGTTATQYYQPIPGQLQWMCDRAIGWAELGRTSNADKKVSILYYNHKGGKDNIGASYLDIGASFTLLLERMEAEGYDIGNDGIPNGSEFIDLFITSRNCGAWAPGELEKVVESGLVTLFPVEEYLPWYNTLPESIRDEVEETWGEAPGDIMVYENKSGEYFVIPTVQLGNVNFIPQPTKAKLSDESLIYHNSTIPLTHQYLATYYWINQVYDADAIVHFGCHGTLEWSPGKEIGLWEYDYPSICADDTPIIYPYIMDNVGEGSQAKHRGFAVMIDHLTPPIIEAGLYGELAELHDKIHSYTDSRSLGEDSMASMYKDTVIELYGNLSIGEDLEVSTGELYNMTDDTFEDFVSNDVHDYLHDLQSDLMPYGVHTFGVAPEDEMLVCMIKSMLNDDFTGHICDVLPKDSGTEEDWEDEADADAMLLLNETILYGTSVSDAQLQVLGFTDVNVTADLELAIEYSDEIAMTTREIDQFIRALDAEYIEPGVGNDPVRNPDALPTGRNFYGFDQRKFPDEEKSAMGAILADQLVEKYYAEHSAYPDKISYTMWVMETLRHGGLMEAQIHSLLGVTPIRDDGRITGFEVIPLEEMTHPRIDVMLDISGLYRDTFAYQVELFDEAVRTVAELNESSEDNYVRRNSLAMEEELLEMGYNETQAHYLSQCRIFSEANGNYDNGMEDAITSTDTWENESELADLFISTSSYTYGQEIWGESHEDLFTLNLMDVDAAIHSDSTNLFGLLDGDGYYSYLGSVGMTVEALTGEMPELYIANQEIESKSEIMTMNEELKTELRSTIFNPTWNTGQVEADYAGMREITRRVENMYGMDVTTDLVSDSNWDEVYDVLFNDKYDIGMDEAFAEYPYSQQSIAARMIDAERTGYWDAPDEVLEALVKEYVESVVENGVTCCHHTCGNIPLDEYIQSQMSSVVGEATAAEYSRLMEEATHRSSSQSASTGTTNQTTSSADSGAGLDLDSPANDQSTPDNYVEGYEMTVASQDNSDNGNSGSGFSSSDIVASILLLVTVGIMYAGFRRQK